MKLSNVSLAVCSAGLAALAVGSPRHCAAADDVSFAGKTVTVTVGFSAGSGTDLFARTFGRHLVRHLPGDPNMTVLNQPGAGGVVAVNGWAKRAKPNGQFLTIIRQSQTDPESLRRTKSKYDPRTFRFVGGAATHSQGLFINKARVKNLTDRSANPVTMGIVGSTLRGGNYQAFWGVELLGWNVKWVRGYRGTAAVRQAMERGEIDMSSFGSAKDAEYMGRTGKFTVISQSGALVNGKLTKSGLYNNAPFMGELVKGKIKDPQAQKAFDYWRKIVQIGIWIALPPRTPDRIVAAYGKAFNATIQDPAFRKEYSRIDHNPLFVNGSDISALLAKVMDVSPQTLSYLGQALKRRGFEKHRRKRKR